MPLFQKQGDKGYGALVAENRFISDIQFAIETALRDRNMTQNDLAKLMDVSPARVSQILGSNGANLTARTVARIANLLGLHACVFFTDPVVETWMQEETQSESLDRKLTEYVTAACEVIEAQDEAPAAPPSNDWNGKVPLVQIAADDMAQSVAA